VRFFQTSTAAALAATALFLAAGCGGGSGAGSGATSAGDRVAGARVFAEAGCGNCHALAAAGSKGTAGPDLDQLKPSRGSVLRQVERGGIGMPSFGGKLTPDEIRAVATFVTESTGGSAQAAADFEPDGTKLASCRGEFACLEQAFGNLAYERGPKTALATLELRMTTDDSVQADCHRIAHTIGAASLKHFEGNVGQAFAAGSAACASGYYHGLLEWRLATASEDRVGGIARTVCSSRPIRANAFRYYQCVHGLGHGLMLYTSYDLPRALDLCHGLVTSFDRISCSGGVFMENQQSSYGLRSKWLRAKNLLYPCTMVAAVDKQYCYLMVTSQILPRVSYDWDRTAAWCRRSDPGFVDICFQSFGRDASGMARGDPDEIRVTCRHAADGERECLYGAVRDILNTDAGDLDGRKLCESVAPRHRSYCFYGIGTILAAVHSTEDARRRACARFAGSRDVGDCLDGALTRAGNAPARTG
jgi:mono/diheme cytochrome c family protein